MNNLFEFLDCQCDRTPTDSGCGVWTDDSELEVHFCTLHPSSLRSLPVTDVSSGIHAVRAFDKSSVPQSIIVLDCSPFCGV